jgi:predicted N-acyltransferase
MSNRTETCEFSKQHVTCTSLDYNSYCNIYGCKSKNKHNHKLCKSCYKDHQDSLEWLEVLSKTQNQPLRKK